MVIRRLIRTLLVVLAVCAPALLGAQANGKVVIPVWLSNIDEVASRAWWNSAIDTYNKTNKMDVYVDLQYVPPDAVDAKMKAAQAAGNAPQLVYVNHATALRDGAGQGLYMPLNEYLNPALLNDLFPNIRQMITAKGNIYSIPLYVEPYSLLYYRKDLFKQAGLNPDQPPRTWDELLSYAQKLTKGNTFGLGIAGSADNGWVDWGWEPVLGMQLVNDDWSKAVVNNDVSRQFITFIKTLYDKGVVPKQPLGPFWDIQPLVDGRLAMQFDGTWAISRIMVDFKDKIDPSNVGIALVPTPKGLKDGDPASALGGWGLAIDGKAKNPKEVADVIAFLALGDPKLNASFVDGGYYAKLPVRKSVADLLSKPSKNKVDAWYNLISKKVVPYSLPEPVYPWDISASLATAIDNVVINGMSVNDALAQSEQEINAVIQKDSLAGANPRQK